ncbi:MAG: hypothetical protein FJ029_14120, partial [Actinobacteria bacterium]|nr:hypothetical protein [Actinomycetota bacterium]
MIRRPDLVQELEDRYAAEHPLDLDSAMRLYEAMWEHARALGALPPSDPWQGVEDDIRLARILAACSP